MTYLQIFIGLVLVAILAYRCIGGVEKKTIVAVRHDGRELRLEKHKTTIGLGAHSESAHLLLDGKMVDTWQHTWPIIPESYPNWVVKTFSAAVNTWTVYVSPSKFSNRDFEQLVAGYEAHRPHLDEALSNQFNQYYVSSCVAIGRIIYGDVPVPLKLVPTARRYEPMVGFGFTEKAVISQEEMIVQPNGKWELSIFQSEEGHSQGGVQLSGQLAREGDRLVFRIPPDSLWQEQTLKVRADAASRADYLRSYQHAEGKKLGDLYRVD